MIVFLINGVSLAGKDTFVNCMVEEYQRNGNKNAVVNISTINPIKDIYTKFFKWDGSKSPKHRKNLNTLKNIWRESCNGPVEYVRTNLQFIQTQIHWAKDGLMHRESPRAVFIMVREFQEMLDLREVCNDLGIQCCTLQVVRDKLEIPSIEQEFLDSHPKDFTYDIVISNPTVPDYPNVPKLMEKAKQLVVYTEAKLNWDKNMEGKCQ